VVMKVMARLCFLAVMILGLPAIAMSEDDVSGKLTIYVVNYPLQYFAQRIAEAHATVAFPVPPDVDPAFWNPGVEVIAEYQRADLIILNGANYAKWIDKVTLPQSKLVDTSASFKDQYIPLANRVTHTHGPGGDHAHTGVASTTWLDFHLAAEQARAIADAMSRKRPALRDIFESNYKALEDDLLRLDRASRWLLPIRCTSTLPGDTDWILKAFTGNQTRCRLTNSGLNCRPYLGNIPPDG